MPVLQEVIERIPALIFSGFMRQPDELTLWPETNNRFLSNLILDTWDEVVKDRVRKMAKHGEVLSHQFVTSNSERTAA